LSLPPPALPRPLAGAELYVSSYEFVARAFSEFKITRTLVGSPVIHGEPMFTASGYLRTVDDVMSMGEQHAKGGVNMLYLLLVLHEKMVNLRDPAAVEAALTFAAPQVVRGDPTLLADEDVPAPQIFTLLLVLLFQASGTFVNDRKQLLVRSTRLPGGEKLSTKAFIEAFSDWSDAHQWLSPLVTEVLFCDIARVQLFFDRIGPITKQWIVSHTSAGSAGPRRVAVLALALGFRVPLVCRVVDVMEMSRMVPEFVIAHIPGSFGELRLEGTFLICILLKLASALKGPLQSEGEVFTACVAGFRDALSKVDKDAFEKSKNCFSETCKSKEARESLDKKLSDALQRMDDEGLLTAITDVAKLKAESACFDKSAADYENHIDICRKLFGTDVRSQAPVPADRTAVPPAAHYTAMTAAVNAQVVAQFRDTQAMRRDLLGLRGSETEQCRKLLKDRSLNATSQDSWAAFLTAVFLAATPQRQDVKGLVV